MNQVPIMIFLLALLFLGTVAAVIRYRRTPNSDLDEQRRRGHFLLGFIVGQGIFWSFILARTDLGAPWWQEYQLFISLLLFFAFLAMIVSILDN